MDRNELINEVREIIYNNDVSSGAAVDIANYILTEIEKAKQEGRKEAAREILAAKPKMRVSSVIHAKDAEINSYTFKCLKIINEGDR
jgi:hypothetical protein